MHTAKHSCNESIIIDNFYPTFFYPPLSILMYASAFCPVQS